MREIKFRAWDVYLEEMIYFDKSTETHFIEFNEKGILTAYAIRESETGGSLLLEPPSETGGSLLLEPPDEELDDLMQFTGLKDKNGKEIYEGDVLYFEEKTGKHIHYERFAIRQNMEWNCGCCYNVYGWEIDFDLEKSEVIGNIHENKELLEGL